MSILERFMAYAQDFEHTFRDDDWSRLEQYFTPDATYEVTNVPFACRLEGRAAVFRGIKKSLDGFDRKFAVRRLAVTSSPEVEGDTLAVSWAGTYEQPGLPPVTIRGRTTARYAGDLIVALGDSYENGNNAEVASWMMKHGAGFDGSYT